MASRQRQAPSRHIASGNTYRRVNVLALWVESQVNGSSPLWGTCPQRAD
ncbi:ArdC-like ssDNA-binding domain-containing protein [Bradyrhizobium sp. DASA03120]